VRGIREEIQEDDIEDIAQSIIDKKSFIWALGQNKDGELGIGSQRDALLPRPIASQLRDGQSARFISSGSHHTALVSKAGEVYVCGSHLHGKLGMASNGILNLTKFNYIPLPVRVKAVACGDYHTLCLSEEGQVFAWGGTLHKKRGEGGKAKDGLVHEPRIVEALADRGAVIVQIDCGDFHSVALADDGILYSWGGGGQSYNKGQCGHGTNDDAELPQIVKGMADKFVTKVAAGGFHTLALTEDDELYSWGSGTYGELGSGNQQSVNKP